MANDPAFDYYGNAPGIWGRLRARWSNMPSAYRYNAVLYGLAVVALSALVLEVALGESSPKFEVATQVAPLTTTTRPRPTTTFGPTTTIDPLAVTTTVPGVAGPEGGASPIGPLTPTSRRAGAPSAGPTSGGGSNTTRPTSPPPSEEQIPDSTFPPLPPPSNPGTTSPPRTDPPPTSPPTVPSTQPSITIPAEWCDRFPGQFGCP